MVFEKLVALGTSCTSGWSRHTVPTKSSTLEIITTPAHLLSLGGEQIAPTISLPTFPSCARARCKHHSDCTRYVPTTFCRHHFVRFTPPPACARLPFWGDLGIVRRRPHTILSMTSLLGMARSSPTSQLGCPAHAHLGVLICGV